MRQLRGPRVCTFAASHSHAALGLAGRLLLQLLGRLVVVGALDGLLGVRGAALLAALRLLRLLRGALGELLGRERVVVVLGGLLGRRGLLQDRTREASA